MRLSFGFTTADFLQAEGRYTHYNFTGGARRLSITGAVGNLLAEQLNGKLFFSDNYVNVGSERGRYFAPTYNASAEMQQPWFGSARNTLALSVFTHRRSAPGIYVDRGYGTSATFTREIALRAPASLNYRFEVTTVEAGDIYFCVNFGVCDRPTLDALKGHQRISPLALTANIDRTNDPFSPNRGYRGRAAIYEICIVNENLRRMVVRKETGTAMKARAIQDGMDTLRTDGWRRVLSGHTTVEEVVRVTSQDEAIAETD